MTTNAPTSSTSSDVDTESAAHADAWIERAAAAREKITGQIGRRVFGQEEVVEHLLISLFVGGHTLMMGVPGLAKTLLVSSLAEILGLNFNRIQFTPDLMPSDITGTDILENNTETGQRHFRFVEGPVFTNLLLADEINRTPPKTQAALLQAMQEREVTVSGKTYKLEPPFLVFATQNPIEQEGTYPLPEAQLDRFMFHVNVDYPDYEDELKIAQSTTRGEVAPLEQVIEPEDILQIQSLVHHVEVSDTVAQYAVKLVRASRPDGDTATDRVKQYVNFGAGPRAVQYLILGSKARALLHGYETPSVEDIRALAQSVMRHRILVNFHGDAENITPDDIIEHLVETVDA